MQTIQAHENTQPSKWIGVIVFLVVITVLATASLPIMLHGDINFGDSPSYLAIYNLKFENANEIHRYRIVEPLVARCVKELIKATNLASLVEHFGKMQESPDILIRFSFWVSNLIGTSIALVFIIKLIHPIRASAAESIAGLLMFGTSRGFLFNIGTPVVDTWEIASLSVATVLLQSRKYIYLPPLMIAAYSVKETATYYIGITALLALLFDRVTTKKVKYLMIVSIISTITLAPLMEGAIISLQHYLGGLHGEPLVPLSSTNTLTTGEDHLLHAANSLNTNLGATLRHYADGILKMISPALLVTSTLGIWLAIKNQKLAQLEEMGRYKSLLYLIGVGSVAGVISGVFGMRLLETVFVLIPFSIVFLRYVSGHPLIQAEQQAFNNQDK